MVKPEDFTKVPVSEATNIPPSCQFVEVFRDRYWAVTIDGCLLWYKGNSPQCNSNRAVTEHLTKGLGHPGADVLFLPLVYRKHACRDYI